MTTSDPVSTLSSTPLITPTTVISLLFSLLLLTTSFLATHYVLPHPRSHRTFLLHAWHTFDFLIHTIFEGSFLYHCIFTYTTIDPDPITADYPHPASLSSNIQPSWLGYKHRSYGAKHSTHPTALLWQEYSNADIRWNTTDPTIVSIELLTVLLAGPLAAYICYLLLQQQQQASSKVTTSPPTSITNKNPDNLSSTTSSSHSTATATSSLSRAKAKSTFLMTILATAELYGGFMTFAPEWLTGSPNLRTDRVIWKWVYLAGFNGVWVLVPGWVLWVSWGEVRDAFIKAAAGARKGKKVR